MADDKNKDDKKKPINVELKTRTAFLTEDGNQFTRNERITLAETSFIKEIGKGFEKVKDKDLGRKPTSSYLNHCDVVSCSPQAQKAYDSFMKK